MKYVDEYRDERSAQKTRTTKSGQTVTRPWVLMEICGGQTHSIVKYGIDYLLPKEVELVHGPGCPVCVTSLEMIDKAHRIAERPGRDFLLIRRHVARARIRSRSAHREIPRRRHTHRLFAAGLPEDCESQPGQESGLFRHRL